MTKKPFVEKTKPSSEKSRILVICLALALATFALYWPVQNHEFVHYDDDQYVTENPHVKTGLTGQSVRWAFTAVHASNWHPLTWLSHMLDCELFDLDPGRHHMTGLLLHIANTLILFLVLKGMTNAAWPSAFVAAAFALHPLHVESVAWVSERKDVLSTFFWLVTMAAYLRYTRSASAGWYTLTVLLFALGLMAKPMLVTLPFVLLLLDYWPLDRFRSTASAGRKTRRPQGPPDKTRYRIVLEKIPLLALSLASSIITFIVQQQSGTVAQIGLLPLRIRAANAAIAYCKYLQKIIWPSRLAVFYPLNDQKLSMLQALGAVLLLVAISICVIKLGTKRKYLLTGWLWYLGTLVPVIGLVQVGAQALADRYTYVPSIGIFIIAAWYIPELTKKLPHQKIFLAISSVAVLLALSVATWLQLGHWRNSIKLFERTLAVTTGNAKIHNNLGLVLHKKGQNDKAIPHIREAINIKPDYANAYNNLGLALRAQGQDAQAEQSFRRAIELNPGSVEPHINLGFLLQQQKKFEQAAKSFAQAIQYRPNDPELYNNLGITMAMQGRFNEAIRYCSRAVLLQPRYAEAYCNLANALKQQGRPIQAAENFRKAISLTGNFAQAHYGLAEALKAQGDYDKALSSYKNALSLRPNWLAAMKGLVTVLQQLPDPAESDTELAVALAERAAEMTNQQNAQVLEVLATAYAVAENFDKAVETAQKALKLAVKSENNALAEQIRKKLTTYSRKLRPHDTKAR